jgi:hypothetical protein
VAIVKCGVQHLQIGTTCWLENESQDQVSLMLHLLIDISYSDLITTFFRVGTQFTYSDLACVCLTMSFITELTLSLSLGVLACSFIGKVVEDVE